jgi:hypothetical protein
VRDTQEAGGGGEAVRGGEEGTWGGGGMSRSEGAVGGVMWTHSGPPVHPTTASTAAIASIATPAALPNGEFTECMRP